MAASAVDVGRGLEVESTTHVRELRKIHTGDMLVTRSFLGGGGGGRGGKELKRNNTHVVKLP